MTMVPGDNTQAIPLEGAVSAADEPRALCIIRDMTNTQWQSSKVTLNLPASTTCSQLLEEVAQRCHYELFTFELVLQLMTNGDSVSINKHPKYTLADIGFRCGNGQRNNLIIGELNGISPRRIEVVEDNLVNLDDLSLGASASPVGVGDGDYTYPLPPAPPPLPADSTYSPVKDYSSYNASPLIKHDTGYVGLVNQAMTCYLNSLLQTLYMTPEFRNALYRWEYDGAEDEKSKSIPYQLQRLFLLLQTSEKHAIETTELTRSFGWDSSEAWQQHDVQELCRVMFDALEHKFRNTDQADLINRLYQGKIKDYVKCLECGNESAREDTYLDIPLPVRPFGSSQAYESVEEALQAFVQPEVLNESNQYFCERCNRKCDAHKGLKFTTFPYLLTMQLKRFDFDYTTMHRIKLNDKVTFPEILNLNCFIKCEHEETNDDASTTDSGSALEEDNVCGQSVSNVQTSHINNSDNQDDDEGIDMELCAGLSHNSQEVTANEKNLRHSLEKGPYLYELFSIMVHSGSANGGHYYAHIKSFTDGHWYCFNDQNVSKVTYDDIRKTYGGGPPRSYYSGAYSSSTNAYMLMYRQIDKDRNAEAMTEEEFPSHIRRMLQTMQQQEENERQLREMERNMCKIKLFWNNPILRRVSETILKVHKDTTLAEASRTAHTILAIDKSVPLERCRLVKYDDTHDSLECSFEDSDDQPIGELLGGAKSTYRCSLLFEIWPADKPMPVYKPGGTTVKVYAVNMEIEEVEPPVTIRSYLTQSVDEFKAQVVQELGLLHSDPQIVLERYCNDLRPLTCGSKSLKAEGFYRSNKVFVERSKDAETEKSFDGSKFHKILDRYEHTISIHVVLPDIDSETSSRLLSLCKAYEAAESDDSKQLGPSSSSARVASGCKRHDATETDDSKHVGSSSYGEFNGDVSPSEESSKTSPQDDGGESSSDDVHRETDEGLGDSECDMSSTGFQGDTSRTSKSGQKTNSGSGEWDNVLAYQSTVVHSDQSEDSSLTDSERTIVGDSPPQNESVLDGSNLQTMKALERLAGSTSSSDGSVSPQEFGEVGRTWPLEEQFADCFMGTSRWHSLKEENKPSEDGRTCKISEEESGQKEEAPLYFRAVQYKDPLTDGKMLRVNVDKRITLAALKKELAPYVGVPVDCFKIYRIYSNNQEFECTRLSGNLVPYNDDFQMVVKVGRALRKGEYRVKIFQLLVSEPEPSQFLIDWIFSKKMTVLQAKKEILPEIKAKCNLDIPLNRCRLRKKSWRTPGAIFIDTQKFEDINIFDNSDVYLEILSEPEKVTSTSQLSVYVRWWHPSTYALDPMIDAVLDDYSVKQLKEKIMEISGIPVEHVDFAKMQGSFPCEMSLLTLNSDLDWNPLVQTLNLWPMYICDDGFVVCFKDRREIPKQLNDEERREVMAKESARLHKLGRGGHSPRKEKALKIYTDSPPTRSSTAITEPELD